MTLRTRRLLALVATVVVVSLGATGCDTSPYAATIDSHVVKATALQAQLRGWAGNPGYVKGFNQANTQSGVTIGGEGPGTYSAAFSAYILDQMVQDSVIDQALAARHQAPSAAALAAARSTLEVEYSDIWQGFSAAFRSDLVAELADSAILERTPNDTATLMSAFSGKQQYFFAQVCTREITVSVLGAGGAIDYAASQSKADQIVDQDYSHGSGTSATPPSGGVVTCYTPAQLENQTVGFFAEVLGLAPGQAAPPQRTTAGYLVLAVQSRKLQHFGPATASVLGYQVDHDEALQQGQGLSSYAPTLVRVLSAAKVKVNPAYGMWDASQLEVEPSSVPQEIYNKINGTPPGQASGQSSGP